MNEVPSITEPTGVGTFTFTELSETGILWLINRVVFHPRGFALALDYEHGRDEQPTSWSLHGDGTEPWSFATGIDDDKFAEVEKLFARQRVPVQ